MSGYELSSTAAVTVSAGTLVEQSRSGSGVSLSLSGVADGTTVTLTVADGMLLGTAVELTVDVVAARLALSVPPAVVSGTSFALTVRAENAHGEVDTGYALPATSTAAVTASAGTLVEQSRSGVGVSLSLSGVADGTTVALTVADGMLSATAVVSVDVVATRLALSAPSAVVSGTSFALTVRGENAHRRGGCGLRAVGDGGGDGLGGDVGRAVAFWRWRVAVAERSGGWHDSDADGGGRHAVGDGGGVVGGCGGGAFGADGAAGGSVGHEFHFGGARRERAWRGGCGLRAVVDGGGDGLGGDAGRAVAFWRWRVAVTEWSGGWHDSDADGGGRHAVGDGGGVDGGCGGDALGAVCAAGGGVWHEFHFGGARRERAWRGGHVDYALSSTAAVTASAGTLVEQSRSGTGVSLSLSGVADGTTVTLTVGDGALAGSVVVLAQSVVAVRLELAASTAIAIVGSSFALTVRALDAVDTVVRNFSLDPSHVAAQAPGGGAEAAVAWAVSSTGTLSVRILRALDNSTVVLTVMAGGVSGSLPLAVAVEASRLVLASQAQLRSGAPFSLEVSGVDGLGNVDVDYALSLPWTVAVASSGVLAVVSGTTSSLTLRLSGVADGATVTLTVADGMLSATVVVSVDVVATRLSELTVLLSGGVGHEPLHCCGGAENALRRVGCGTTLCRRRRPCRV